MQWTEQQNYAIAQTELDRVFFQEFDFDDNQPSLAHATTPEIFKQMPFDRAAFIEEVYAGPGLFQVTGEVQNIGVDLPRVANKKTSYVKDYTNSVPISKDLFDDNMHGVWARTVKEFALMARVTMDDNAFALWRGAFTTTLTADGQAFIGNHTLIKSGATYSNLITGALNPTTLKTAMVKLRQQPNQAGVILSQSADALLVPSQLLTNALELTDTALVVDSANNNINVWRSTFGYKVFSSPFLDAVAGGSDTAWFLIGRHHSVTRIVRQGVETYLRNWGMSTDRTYLYQANFREVVFVTDYVGVVGSTGL